MSLLSRKFHAILSFRASRLEQNSPQVSPSFSLTYNSGSTARVGRMTLVVELVVVSGGRVGSVAFTGLSVVFPVLFPVLDKLASVVGEGELVACGVGVVAVEIVGGLVGGLGLGHR